MPLMAVKLTAQNGMTAWASQVGDRHSEVPRGMWTACASTFGINGPAFLPVKG